MHRVTSIPLMVAMAQKLMCFGNLSNVVSSRDSDQRQAFLRRTKGSLMDFFVPSCLCGPHPSPTPQNDSSIPHARTPPLPPRPIPDQRPYQVDRSCAVDLRFWVAFGAAVWDFDPDLPDLELANSRPPFSTRARSRMRQPTSRRRHFPMGPRNSHGHLSSEAAQ
jgi:hypothetical protein